MGISKRFRKSRGRKSRGRKTRRSESTLRRKNYRRGGGAIIYRRDFAELLEIDKFYTFYDSNNRALYCGKLLRLLTPRSTVVRLNNYTDFFFNETAPPSMEVMSPFDAVYNFPVSYAIENNGSCIRTTPTPPASELPTPPASELPTPPSNPFMPPL